MKWKWSSVGRRFPKLMPVALLAVLAGALVYWLKFSPILVQACGLERGSIAAEVLGTGTLEARVKTSVSPKISGRIAEVRTDQNRSVSAGEVLFTLDDGELRQQVAIAEAEVAVETAAIERLRSDQDRAAAVGLQARKQHERVRVLMERAVTSQEELDKATEALSVAMAGLSQAEAAITEGRRRLVAAEKTLEYHRTRLADTKVTAPFDGLIVRRHREPGDVVVPGSAVLSLIDTRELWISAWVDETGMANLELGQPARVVFRSEPERAFPGKVARLGREADRETREFVVDVQVLELPKNWAVGQRAEVFIETSRKQDALLLPTECVVWQGGEAGVFVSQAGRATWRKVQIGLHNPVRSEVASGLQVGERVILQQDLRAKLSEGRRIAVQ